MISRRLFVSSLICAPAVVRAESLMRVVPITYPDYPLFPHQIEVLRELRRLQDRLDTALSSKWDDFNCIGVTTGRFTSNAPNLSQVPKRDSLRITPNLRKVLHAET